MQQLKKLEGLESVLVQHPGERAILTKLNCMDAVASVLAKVIDFQVRQSELDLLGGGLHVTSKNMPDVYRIFRETCEVLNMPYVPELYLGELPIANAFAVGADKAYINITSQLFFRLDESEIRFMFGHELGHILCGHTKYNMLVRLMLHMGYSVPGIDVILRPVMNLTVRPLLMLWNRRSEFSADRAGLLACQDLEAVASFFLKICGLPLNFYGKVNPLSIFDQAADFQKLMDKSLLDTTLASMSVMNSTHPRAITRVAELKGWIDDGMYNELLDGTKQTRAVLANLLRSDPAEAELLQSYLYTLTRWGQTELRLDRAEIAPTLRRVLFGEKLQFGGTVLAPILQIVAKIIPSGVDRVRYELEVLYLKDGSPFKTNLDVLVYPHQTDRSYISSSLAKEFIRNGEQPIALELYRVKA